MRASYATVSLAVFPWACSAVYLLRRLGPCDEDMGIAREYIASHARGIQVGGGNQFKVHGAANLDILPITDAAGTSTTLGDVFLLEDDTDNTAPSVIYIHNDATVPSGEGGTSLAWEPQSIAWRIMGKFT